VLDSREIVNGILYVCRTGIAWEYLPHDFPPYKTVYDYYAKWAADGTTETLHDSLRQQVRVARGRASTPTAAIIDSQSVKTSCNVAEAGQGIDARKKIKSEEYAQACADATVGDGLTVRGEEAGQAEGAVSSWLRRVDLG